VSVTTPVELGVADTNRSEPGNAFSKSRSPAQTMTGVAAHVQLVDQAVLQQREQQRGAAVQDDVPPGSCLSFATVCAASPVSAVAFHGSEPCSVRVTTSFGIWCIASAYGPVLRDQAGSSIEKAFGRVLGVDSAAVTLATEKARRPPWRKPWRSRRRARAMPRVPRPMIAALID
jgi:hypothetical protein